MARTNFIRLSAPLGPRSPFIPTLVSSLLGSLLTVFAVTQALRINVKTSFDFTERLEGCSFSQGSRRFVVDVRNMYTCMPLWETIGIIC